MKDVVCPKCFTKSDIKDLTWGCSNSDCDREMLPTTVHAGDSSACLKCSKPMDIRFCPECGFPIPIGKEATESMPISIVGSEGSGKSNYLAVLINEIRHSVGKVYNCSLYPIGGDDTMVQYQDLYYKPLYENSTCLTSTDQDSVRPLVYSMIFDGQRSGKINTLTFYDACGANFRNERVMANYNRSIYNSKGILFLVDPTQLPGLREQYVAQGKPVLKDDFSALLARTIQLIRDGSAKRDLKNKITIPIAICISKIDLIRHLLDDSSFLNYPSRHLNQDSFDLIDFSTCHYEIQALVDNWAGADLINQVQAQFEHCGFFGFSALGTQPSLENHIPYVAPHRVTDPFLWLLAQNKIIQASHHTFKKI